MHYFQFCYYLGMGIFYTRKGDSGFSHIGKVKINKLDCNIEALGQLDELNCLIGILKSNNVRLKLRKILHEVQENLFIIQAIVAYKMLSEKRVPPQIGDDKIKSIETLIDEIEASLKVEKKFVIPGTNKISAELDYIRAKSRTVERSILAVKMKNKLVGSYLNRLSSLFFALARQAGQKPNKKEENPKYK